MELLLRRDDEGRMRCRCVVLTYMLPPGPRQPRDIFGYPPDVEFSQGRTAGHDAPWIRARTGVVIHIPSLRIGPFSDGGVNGGDDVVGMNVPRLSPPAMNSSSIRIGAKKRKQQRHICRVQR